MLTVNLLIRTTPPLKKNIKQHDEYVIPPAVTIPTLLNKDLQGKNLAWLRFDLAQYALLMRFLKLSVGGLKLFYL